MIETEIPLLCSESESRCSERGMKQRTETEVSIPLLFVQILPWGIDFCCEVGNGNCKW